MSDLIKFTRLYIIGWRNLAVLGTLRALDVFLVTFPNGQIPMQYVLSEIPQFCWLSQVSMLHSPLFDGSTGFNVAKKLAALRLGAAAAPQGSGQQLRAWEDSAVVSTQKEKGIPWNLIQKMESSL
jgi:hypothetical protein